MGGAAVLAEAIVAAERNIVAERVTDLAARLAWAAALRRVGPISDALDIGGLAGKLRPLKPPVAYLDLEPGLDTACVWRDRRWRVRWAMTPSELAKVAFST